ncbi:Calcium-dependent mitochondrial ATP-magnesium/phosphate carrier protein 1 (AtAPC1) (Mitochondrial ATP-Mg/Pi carrier protein 1) [Durusdinium trenchii]
MTHSLSESENALVGITAGIVDISCIQWAYYLKNARQQRLPLTWNPRILYRGYVANCANVAAGTSFQFATAGALKKVVLCGEHRELTDAEKVCTGFLAGFASGVMATPLELVMTQQQLKGGSALQNARSLPPSTVLRGCFPTCTREGLFTAAYLGVAPVLRAHLSSAFPGTNEELHRMLAALAGAACSGILSHPFDTAKTCMQGDIERKTYGSFAQTCREIYSSGGGFRGFYRGLEFRFLRQVWQVWVLDLLRVKLSPLLFPYRFKADANLSLDFAIA